jgi:hypothetical protein
LNCVESEFSKHDIRNRLLGADIATDQTKPVPFNTDVIPRNAFRINHRRRVAPSDLSLIKQSGQMKVVHPEKPNGVKHLFISTSVSTMNQKDERTQPNVPSSIEIHNRNFADEMN